MDSDFSGNGALFIDICIKTVSCVKKNNLFLQSAVPQIQIYTTVNNNCLK